MVTQLSDSQDAFIYTLYIIHINFFKQMGKRTALVFVCALLCSSVLCAQNEPTGFDLIGYAPEIPPSPGAAALGKYGQYEVNLAYGVPEISIPLFEVNAGSLRLPASLSYHASGNRASDEGSWVGLGWALQLGGVVTRTVRGQPDEMFPQDGFIGNADWYNEPLVNEQYRLLERIIQGSVDTEPDQYSFNFPGYSGGFVFNNTGGITVLPFQPLKVEVVDNAPCPPSDSPLINCRTFKITTPDGVQYFFEEMEVSTAQAGRSYTWKTFVSSWYLSRIVHPNGYDVIGFTYDDLGRREFAYSRSEYLEYSSSMGLVWSQKSPPPATVSRVVIPNEKRIAGVSFRNGSVEVTGSTINVYDLRQPQTRVHTASLAIGQFAQPAEACPSGTCTRKKLTSVTVDGKKYAFKYNETIPQFPYSTNSVDHWGFYNRMSNGTSRMPSITFGNNRFGKTAIRSTDSLGVKYAILERITYPTGGYTEFEFGVNRVSSAVGGAQQFDAFSNKSYTLYPKNGNSITSGDWVWPEPNESVRFNFDDAAPASQVTFDPTLEVTIEYWTPLHSINSDGVMTPRLYAHEPQFQFNLAGNARVNNYNGVDAVFPSGDYESEVRIKKYTFTLNHGVPYQGNSPLGTGFIRIQSSDPAETGDRAAYVKITPLRRGTLKKDYTRAADVLAGGVRIHSISNFDANDQLLTRKSYRYEEPPNPRSGGLWLSSGVFLTCTAYDVKHLSPYFSNYIVENLMETTGCPPVRNAHRLIVHSDPQGKFNGGYPVGYSYVVETVTGKDGALGKTEYQFSMSLPDRSAASYPYPPAISMSHLRGKPVFVKYYRKGEAEPFKVVFNEYETGGNNVMIQGAVVTMNRTFPFEQSGGECDVYADDVRKYAVAQYQFYENSESRLIKRTTTERLPDADHTFVTSEAFRYADDRTHQMLVEKTTEAPGQNATRLYTYQYQLSANGIPGNVREEVSKIDNKVVAARRIDYTIDKPTAIYTWRGAEPDAAFTPFDGTTADDGYAAEKDVEVTYYTPSNRTKTVREKDGIYTSYLWDIPSHLVMGSVRNCADPDRVSYISFDGMNHRFTFAGGTSATGTGLAGGRGYSLATGAIACQATVGGKYIVEFWHDSQSGGAPAVRWTSGSTSTPVVLRVSESGRWRHVVGVVDASALPAGSSFVAEVSGSGLIDEIRLYPADAQMTTYSHKRFVGVRSVIDPAGILRQYDYDANGRLDSEKLEDGSILKQFEYNLIHK
jgi:YD repeat-containing protein